MPKQSAVAFVVLFLAISLGFASCARGPSKFTARMSFREDVNQSWIQEGWIECQFSDGNVSLDFTFKPLQYLTVTPKEYTSIEPTDQKVPPLQRGVSQRGSNREGATSAGKRTVIAPFAGGYVASESAPPQKILVSDIRGIIQVGQGVGDQAGEDRVARLMAPKVHRVLLRNGRELTGEIAPHIVSIVGTRPSGDKHAMQITSLLFQSVEIDE
ncbi:MAG: hypothetical protein NTZ17_16795 [Phycisphaerae bacterium]|nr:hypothetical protein [Phycisphaerae bacterium]